jgi:hypothetical protein
VACEGCDAERQNGCRAASAVLLLMLASACSSASSSGDGAAENPADGAKDRPAEASVDAGAAEQEQPSDSSSPDLAIASDAAMEVADDVEGVLDDAAQDLVDAARDFATVDQPDGSDAAPDAADGGASSDSEVSPAVCGNGIVESGEECDAPDGLTCQHCKLTCCGLCLRTALYIGGTRSNTCDARSGQDRIDCYALLNCVLGPEAGCPQTQVTTCGSASAPCSAQFRAVAKSTDDAEIERQLQDPATTVSKVVADARSVDAYYCGHVSCYGIGIIPDPHQPQLPPGCPMYTN